MITDPPIMSQSDSMTKIVAQTVFIYFVNYFPFPGNKTT
jgi:hypothetical protein